MPPRAAARFDAPRTSPFEHLETLRRLHDRRRHRHRREPPRAVCVSPAMRARRSSSFSPRGSRDMRPRPPRRHPPWLDAAPRAARRLRRERTGHGLRRLTPPCAPPSDARRAARLSLGGRPTLERRLRVEETGALRLKLRAPAPRAPPRASRRRRFCRRRRRRRVRRGRLHAALRTAKRLYERRHRGLPGHALANAPPRAAARLGLRRLPARLRRLCARRSPPLRAPPRRVRCLTTRRPLRSIADASTSNAPPPRRPGGWSDAIPRGARLCAAPPAAALAAAAALPAEARRRRCCCCCCCAPTWGQWHFGARV